MDGLLFLLAIVYMIASAMGSKNKKRRQEAAKKIREAQNGAGTFDAADAQPEAPEPRAPRPAPAGQEGRPRPSRPVIQRFPEDFDRKQAAAPAQQPARIPVRADSAPAPAGKPAAPAREKAAPAAPLRRNPIESRLTQIQATQRHTLEASSLTGHAHEESSISGVQEGCVPTARRTPVSGADEAPAARPAPILPVLDAGSARLGILYGEILGKPKALRR